MANAVEWKPFGALIRAYRCGAICRESFAGLWLREQERQRVAGMSRAD